MKHLGLIKSLAMSGGDWVIHVLVACSVLALAVIIERALYFRRRGTEQAGRELREELARAERAGEERAEALHAGLLLERRRLERRLVVLHTLGNNAPFIGLLGTVLGVVRAFHDLAFSGGAGPEVVMQGISEALVATAVGILVALPCVIAYNWFEKAVEERLTDVEIAGRRRAAGAEA